MSTIEFTIEASIPKEHMEDWLKHIAKFDIMYSGCAFAITAKSDDTVDEIAEIMENSGVFDILLKLQK